MRKLVTLATPIFALLVLFPAAGAPAASTATALQVRGGMNHLLAPGDKAKAEYAVSGGSQRVRGTLYLRTDRQRAFLHIGLTQSHGYRASIPARLLRARQLFYYAVFRDGMRGRSLTLPKGGA